MRKRPLSITITGWLFILAGTVAFIYHLSDVDLAEPFANDAGLVLPVRLLGVAAGVLVLRGIGLGRWLLIAWMAYHVVLSYFHTIPELIIHALFLVSLAVILFNRRATAYFRAV